MKGVSCTTRLWIVHEGVSCIMRLRIVDEMWESCIVRLRIVDEGDIMQDEV